MRKDQQATGIVSFFPERFTSTPGTRDTLEGLDVAECGMIFHHAALVTMNAPLKGSRLQFHCHKRLVRNVVFAAKSKPGGR